MINNFAIEKKVSNDKAERMTSSVEMLTNKHVTL